MHLTTALSGELLTWAAYCIPFFIAVGWITAIGAAITAIVEAAVAALPVSIPTAVGTLGAAASLAQGVKAGAEGNWAGFGTGVGGAALGGLGAYLSPVASAVTPAANAAVPAGEAALSATGPVASGVTDAASGIAAGAGDIASASGGTAIDLAAPVGDLTATSLPGTADFAAFNPAAAASSNPSALNAVTGPAADAIEAVGTPAAANPAATAANAGQPGFPPPAFDDMAGNLSSVPDVNTMTPKDAGGLGGAGGGAETGEAFGPGFARQGAELGGPEGQIAGDQAGNEILQAGGSQQDAIAGAKAAGDNAGRIKVASELGPRAPALSAAGPEPGAGLGGLGTNPNPPALGADTMTATGQPGMFDPTGPLSQQNLGSFLDGAKTLGSLANTGGKFASLAEGPPQAPLPMPPPMPRRQAPPMPIPQGFGPVPTRPGGGIRPLPITGF